MKEVPQSTVPLNNLPASSPEKVPSAGRPSDRPEVESSSCGRRVRCIRVSAGTTYRPPAWTYPDASTPLVGVRRGCQPITDADLFGSLGEPKTTPAEVLPWSELRLEGRPLDGVAREFGPLEPFEFELELYVSRAGELCELEATLAVSVGAARELEANAAPHCPGSRVERLELRALLEAAPGPSSSPSRSTWLS